MPQTLERKENIEKTSIKSDESISSRQPDLEPSRKEIVIPREIKSWMEKVEETSTSTDTQVSDTSTQSPLTHATPTSPKITLPVTRSGFVAGFKKTISDAGRWLSVFIFRLIKMKKGKVVFKPPQDES